MKTIFVLIIKIYQKTISPILQVMFGNACRFTPTCSQYTIEALERFGTVKGLLLGVRRFLKCHPFGPSGFDPVPTKNNK